MNAKILFAAAAIAAAPLAAQPASAQSVGYVTVDLILRTGPDINYPPVSILPAGTQVTVFGCIDAYLWCDVAVGYDRGWVAGQFVSVAYGPQRYPLTYYGPHYGFPIVSFVLVNYWDRYYRGRPWYRERDRWISWDYKGKRWHRGYDAKKWEDPRRGYYNPKKAYYDPKRGYYDPKRGYYDPKKRSYDYKSPPPRYAPKKEAPKFDPKKSSYDPKKGPGGDPKKDRKKGDDKDKR